MFLYTKYFLVFLSFSIFSFLSAMDISKIEKQKQRKELNDHLEKEQLQNIKNLLQERIDVDLNLFEIGPEKKPIICVAAEHNDVELIKLLLERGVDINTRNSYGNTALYISVNRGNDFLREYLLQKGANPNISSYLMTPLESAKLNKDAGAVKSLIQHSADINNKMATKLIKNTDFNLKKEYYLHIKTVLLVLKQCKRILYNNSDLRFLILSYLPEYHCHTGLYKELLNRKCELKPFALPMVEAHTKIVQEILHIKNKDNKNILELFPSITELNEKLLKDSTEFNEKYPDIIKKKDPDISAIKDNLAFQILKKYAFKYDLLIPEDVLAADCRHSLWLARKDFM